MRTETQLLQSRIVSTDGLLATAALQRATWGWLRHPTKTANRLAKRIRPQAGNFFVIARDLRSPLQITADSAAITLLSVITGTAYHLAAYDKLGPTAALAITGAALSVLFAVMAGFFSGADGAVPTTRFDRAKGAVLAWSLAFAVLVFVLFTLKVGGIVSRGSVLALYFTGIPAMAAWRALAPALVASCHAKAGLRARECIVIGDNSDLSLETFATQLMAINHSRPTVITFNAGCNPSLWPLELKQFTKRVMDTARGLGPGEIFIYAGSIPNDRLAVLGRTLRVLPRAIFIIPDAQVAPLFACKTTAFGKDLAVEIRHEPMGLAQRTAKRVIDVCISSVAIVVLAPLLLVTALAIKLDTPGPVLFRQNRNGYKGVPFNILKFRSMRVMENGAVVQQVTRNDSRVTRMGRFMRKTSIDELPQLFNVLMGEMSLVGPRPHAMVHDEICSRCIANYEVRQHVKPGLTGWAQVNGLRGETATLDAMYRRVELDLWYAVNASVLLDITIMLRTAVTVFRQTNAY